MIACRNLSKNYGETRVLENFSYTFPAAGFVLLYGESGCGKTTLLNILAGLIPFDNGAVWVGGKRYEKQVSKEEVRPFVGYITQDPHFVDYLTVEDNLRLCSVDDEAVSLLLQRFEMERVRDHFPGTLSGGEKQRLAIMQALLAGKDVLILDEPTSALDKENKENLFRILEKLKSAKLIICSSHDEEARKYADDVLDFHALRPPAEALPDLPPPCAAVPAVEPPKRKLWPFFNRWYTSGQRERRSKWQLILVVVLAVFCVCLCDTPENKLHSNLEYTYGLNQLSIVTSGIQEATLARLRADPSVKEVVLQYNRSVPYEAVEDGGTVTTPYDLTVDTLPINRDAFALADRIQYGSYFTGPDEVLLSAEKAAQLGEPADLIGSELQLDLYDKSYRMKIRGIFKPFTKTEKQYLRASGIGNDDFGNVFISGGFTERYIADTEFFTPHGERVYVVYYSSFSAMQEGCDFLRASLPDAIVSYTDIDPDLRSLFDNLFVILFPMALVIIALAVLFYFQMQKIEFQYNRHIFSVYDYLGYSFKEIRRCLLLGNLKEMLIIQAVSLLIAFPVMLLVNAANSHWVVIPFQLFTFNLALLAVLIGFILLLCVLLSVRTIRSIRSVGWYAVLLEQRDLL
ncbi:ATP-binding cassette domain-containing protein [Anaeromassilibacillus sp. SJQ-5]